MSFTLLSVVILAVMALVIYFQVAKGYKKGLLESFINLSVSLVSVFLAAVLSALISAIFSGVVLEVAKSSIIYEYLEEFAGDLSIIAGIIAQVAFSILLYIPLFFLVRFIMRRIVKRALKKRLMTRSESDTYLSENESFVVRNGKTIGGILGVVSGFVICVALFMPFVGLMKTVPSVLNITKNIMNVDAIENSPEINMIESYADDFSINFIYSCGGGAVYDIATTMIVDGEMTSFNEELETMRSIDFSATEYLFDDTVGLSEDQLLEVENLMADIDESVFMRHFCVQMIRNMSSRWVIHKKYAGLKRPADGLDPTIDEIFDGMLSDLAQTTVSSYCDDIMTSIELVSVVSGKSYLLENADYQYMLEHPESALLMGKINTILRKNSDMPSLNYAIDKVSARGLAREVLNTERHTDFSREVLYSDLAMALNRTKGLTTEARETSVAIYTSDTMEKFGLPLNTELNKRITSCLLTFDYKEAKLLEEEKIRNEALLEQEQEQNGNDEFFNEEVDKFYDQFFGDATDTPEIEQPTDTVPDEEPEVEDEEEDYEITVDDIRRFFESYANGGI